MKTKLNSNYLRNTKQIKTFRSLNPLQREAHTQPKLNTISPLKRLHQSHATIVVARHLGTVEPQVTPPSPQVDGSSKPWRSPSNGVKRPHNKQYKHRWSTSFTSIVQVKPSYDYMTNNIFKYKLVT